MNRANAVDKFTYACMASFAVGLVVATWLGVGLLAVQLAHSWNAPTAQETVSICSDGLTEWPCVTGVEAYQAE